MVMYVLGNATDVLHDTLELYCPGTFKLYFNAISQYPTIWAFITKSLGISHMIFTIFRYITVFNIFDECGMLICRMQNNSKG